MAMYCKYSERVYGNEDVRDCYIISEGAPTSISGADIDNLADSAKVSVGSLCVDGNSGKKYIVGIDEEWHECSAGGGGGYPEPSGVLQVTANGLIDVKDWAQANVNVSGNGLGVHDIRLAHGKMDGYNVSTFFSDLENDSKSLSEEEIKLRIIASGDSDFTVSIDYNGSNTDLVGISNRFGTYRTLNSLVNAYGQSATIEVYLPWNMTTFNANLFAPIAEKTSKLYIRGDASMHSNCTIDSESTAWQYSAITDVYVPWSQSDRDISTEAWFQAIGNYSGAQATAHYNATYDETTGELIA